MPPYLHFFYAELREEVTRAQAIAVMVRARTA
jgi:hypothetical protein